MRNGTIRYTRRTTEMLRIRLEVRFKLLLALASHSEPAPPLDSIKAPKLIKLITFEIVIGNALIGPATYTRFGERMREYMRRLQQVVKCCAPRHLRHSWGGTAK
eukprot:6213187-Pleurochrysis_carterae.AAC.2